MSNDKSSALRNTLTLAAQYKAEREEIFETSQAEIKHRETIINKLKKDNDELLERITEH